MLIDRISPFFLDFGDLEMGGGEEPVDKWDAGRRSAV